MVDNLRESALKNFIWRLLERFGASGVTLIVSVILARLLNPDVYGLVAIVTVIISFTQVFVDSGLGTALVQKKDSDNLDFSSVFYFNLLLSLVLYGIIYFIAPFIADFYRNSQLCSVIRVLCTVIIISAVKSIQQAYVTKHLIFKQFFFATLGGTVCAAAVGILMAYHDAGIWALVFQIIVNQSIDTAILWITVKWRPTAVFSWRRLKALLSFGIRILGANLVASIYQNVRQLSIGKMYSTTDLAYYNQGYKYPSFMMNNVNTSIDSVLFPVMVRSQGSRNMVRGIVRKSIQIESFVLFPLLTGLCVCAPRIILFLIGEKWMESVPFLRIFCLSLLINSLHVPHFNSLKSLGRSDLIFKVEVFKKSIDAAILIISLMYGVLSVALGTVAEAIISYLSTAWVNGRMIDYPLSAQAMDILPAFLMSALMGAAVYAENAVNLTPAAALIVQAFTGLFIYVLTALWIKPSALLYAKQIVGSFLRSRI